MSLMQVLTRDSLQSTTTPYAFLGSSTFIQEPPRDNCISATSDSLYFSARERNNSSTIPSSDASSNVVVGGEQLQQPQQHYSSTDDESLKLSTIRGGPGKFKDKAAAEAGADEWRDPGTQQQHQTMSNNTNSLQHVAQQSRREKLRIPGSLQHPASPPQSTGNSNQGDHSGGLALEMRQSDLQHQSETMEPRGYGGHTGDMLSVYHNPMLSTSELYNNFSTDAELLNAVSAKNQGYLCVAGADGMPQPPALMGSGYPGQAGFSNPMSKNWPNGQISSGQFTGNTTTSGLSATLLVGTGLQPASTFGSGRDVGAYLSGPNAQDAMQLYLMNAAYGNYPDGSSPAGNMIFQLGGNSVGSQQPHLTGIPLQNNSLSQNSQVTSVSSSPVGYGSARGAAGSTQAYGNWRNGDELLFMPGSERAAKSFSNNNQESSTGVGLSHSVNEFGEYNIRETSLGAQHQPIQVENSQASAAGYQSLSLSLSSQQPQPLPGYQTGLESPAALSQDSKRQQLTGGKLSGDLSHFRRDFGANKSVQMDTGSSAMSASFSIISSSRYLKACQQLLEEVCSVGRGAKNNGKSRTTGAGPSPSLTSPTSDRGREGGSNAQDLENSSGTKDHSTGGATATNTTNATASNVAAAATTSAGGNSSPKAKGTATNNAPATSNSEPGESASTLTTEERQEFEMKKSKLIAMLQEVDRRYRQYNDQMQVVISSFDAVAGSGSATPYTALALQAMSRYFRCLKDAITGQIQLVCKALGEEDISKQLTTKSPTSRLRFIDQQIRQQRAFQQLGMLNQHAWRPQRGLPERSVSILRAWLFEHFLHPYPKDADKMMLARQTGLTRSQVSNWFINARVRLWKPMVEEMYQEETRDHELDAAVSRMHTENEEAAAAAAGYHHRVGDTTAADKLEQQHQGAALDKSKDLDYVEGTDYLRSKQNLGSMDSQMYDTQQQQQQQQQQLKRTRFGVHESDMLQLPSSNMDVEMKPDVLTETHHQHHHHLHLLPQAQQQQQQQQHFAGFDGSGGIRFNAGAGFAYNHPAATSGVSLTLGLQHSENSGLSTSGAAYRQAFMQQQQHSDYASFENASLIS